MGGLVRVMELSPSQSKAVELEVSQAVKEQTGGKSISAEERVELTKQETQKITGRPDPMTTTDRNIANYSNIDRVEEITAKHVKELEVLGLVRKLDTVESKAVDAAVERKTQARAEDEVFTDNPRQTAIVRNYEKTNITGFANDKLGGSDTYIDVKQNDEVKAITQQYVGNLMKAGPQNAPEQNEAPKAPTHIATPEKASSAAMER